MSKLKYSVPYITPSMIDETVEQWSDFAGFCVDHRVRCCSQSTIRRLSKREPPELILKMYADFQCPEGNLSGDDDTVHSVCVSLASLSS